MAQTYTSQWFTVSNGDVTTLNPQSLVSTNKGIRILNAEIQWEGVEQTTESTTTETNTNTGSATATTDTTTDYATHTNTGSTGSLGIPSVPSGYSFNSGSYSASYSITLTGDITAFVELDDNQGGYESGTFSNNSGTNNYSLSVSGSYGSGAAGGTLSVSDNVTITDDGGGTFNGGSFQDISASTEGTDTTTTVDAETEYVSYPSPPSGYTFDQHFYKEEKNGVEQDSGFVYTNSVGETRSVTSNDPDNTWTLEMETLGEKTTTSIEDTKDPRVTRDVDGDSGSVTLDDGERSSWYSLSGLDPNREEFYHDIDGSGEARFRFRFDWEKIFPDVVKQLRVYDADSDATRLVALADPSDSQLKYNAIRGHVSQAGQVLAVDVTDDPSDPSAISSHRLYHPVHGTLYPRYYDTVT